MQLFFSARMNVVGGTEIVTDPPPRFFERPLRERRLRLLRAQRRRSDAEKSKPHAFAILARGKSCHGEIAVAAREFAKAKAHIFCRRRNADGGEHVAGPERGFV